MRIHHLSHAVHHALLAGAALGLTALPSGVAGAQEAEATTLDRIEVTGSRIRQVDIETAQPVLSISRQDIENQGFQSVADILQNITAAGTPPLSRAAPLGAGEAAGGQAIDLRNLGAQRTLVLLNGKRLGVTTTGVQDISTIPAAMVERIEVLKDGASAVYGSDAMAGVVNIITRTNYEGIQGSVYFGQYSEGDGAVEKYDFVMGASNDRGSITIGAEYAKEDDVWMRDRPFSATPLGDRHPTLSWTPVGQYGGFVSNPSQALPNVTYPAPTDTNPDSTVRVVLRPGGDANNPADYINQQLGTVHTSNYVEQMHLRTPLERKSLFVDGSYEITDSIRLRSNMLYSNRISDRQIAGYPYQAASFGTPMSADSYFNPLDEDIGNWWRRPWEVPRTSTSDVTTWRFGAALEGSFQVGERYFDWDVGALYNQNKVIQSSFGNLNLANVQAAVGPSFMNDAGQVQCGTPDDPIAFTACIPWNPFLAYGEAGPGSLDDQALQNFLFQREHSTGETETTIYTANLTGGLFELPAGEMSFAVGVETRKEEGEFIPDALSVSGGSTNLGARPTRGSYTEDSVYGELYVPILMGVTGAQELSLNLSSRYSEFDTFGDTLNSKFGIKWKPIDDLLVRATWAQGFRAPNIANLYGGGSQTFASFTDPCDTVYGASATDTAVRARCAQDIANADTYRQLQQGFVPTETASAQTPLAFFSGAGNPNLEPEESTSTTVGFVWSPGFAEGLSMNVDWWEIEIDNTIVLDTPTQMLDDCYIENIASRCTTFTRDPVTGIVNNMNFGSRNAGYVEVEGFDFGAAYRIDTGYGRFGVDLQNTYTVRNEFKSDDVSEFTTQANSFGGNFRLRSNLNLTWEQGDFGASWAMRYHSAMKEECLDAEAFPGECSDPDYIAANPSQSGPTNRTGSVTFNDVQLRWSAPWNATISVGANNVFDRYGPPMYSAPNSNTNYYGGFDIGRFVYMKYQQRF
ncbi:TonB-dependent receptor [Luteimonas sp. RD2P54]|uniref:TonB-dependent receptor n=1 Tax=Luteimonas endophytica TaxID=3042023 RepID=A0ABT6J7G8_9GAMM|nr:TonB-dependent receptor [Luteimonas endophytica]MDH5822143.1 TonB-dependent receptor [Luteimonas endophytica]